MNTLRRLCQLFLSLSLTLCFTSFAIGQISSTGSGLNALLSQSGLYEFTAKQAQQSLANSPRVPVEYQALFTQSLESSLDGAHVEAMLKPAIVDIASWLSQPDTTPPPDVIIILKPAKDSLITKMADGGLPPLELAGLQAQLGQQIPDQVTLSNLGQLTGQPSETDPDTTQPTDTNALVSGLKSLKQFTQIIRLTLLIALTAAVVFTLIIIWMRRRDGRALWRSPAWTYIFAAVSWLVISLLIPFILPITQQAPSMETIAQTVIPAVVHQILDAGRWPALITLLLGLVFYAISFLVPSSNGLPNTVGQLRTPTRR